MTSTRSWLEKDLQLWLECHAHLPQIGDLAFLADASPLRRHADLLFLASDGALVIVEVKNERTTREVIGQALEYAARLSTASLEELAEIYGFDLAAARKRIRQRFGKQVAMTTIRRIVVLAPSFDLTCYVTFPYLRQLVGAQGTTFHLARARLSDDGFAVVEEVEPALTSKLLPGACGITSSGSLYVVLDSGVVPVLWRIGRELSLEAPPAGKGTIKREHKTLHVLEKCPEWLVLDDLGSCWVKTADPAVTGVVLGAFQSTLSPTVVVMARLRDGAFDKLQRKTLAVLHREWARCGQRRFDWRALSSTNDDAASS